MASRTIKRLLYGSLGTLGVALSGFALFLLVETTDQAGNFQNQYINILFINIAGVVALLLLTLGNLWRLFGDYRKRVPGAKLKARMVGMFIALAMVPLLIVFFFSVRLIHSGIDNWFSVDVEQGLDDALALSRAALETQMRDDLATTRQIAKRLRDVHRRSLIFELSMLRRQSGASEITIFGRNKRIIATSSDRSASTLPKLLKDEVTLQIRQNRPFVSLDELDREIRTAVPFSITGSQAIVGVIQAHFPIAERLGVMADNVTASYNEYKSAVYFRDALKRVFSLTLTVVLLLSLLGSIYGALIFSRRLVSPIQGLVAGTRAVAKGDFDTRLPTPSRDEIGFLVSSFNDMTQRLSTASHQAAYSQALVEEERTKLEVILARLSTGVVSLESDLRIRTANQAAGAIVNVDLGSRIGEYLPEVAAGEPLLEQLVDIARLHVNAGEMEWREQLVLRGEVGRRVLTCACTALPGDAGQGSGFVIVFDDITALLQAQRDAAWGEVARRLAHEVKNPLTPIQLSAERLRRKYLHTLKEDDAQVLDRATHTIVQQVEAMKEMVNAFSDYARAPDIDINRFNLDRLVHEVVDLYRAQESKVRIILKTDPDLPQLEADAGRIRQILHNLLRNAIEALENTADGQLELTVACAEFMDAEVVEILVADNGPGFQVGSVSQVFDPYVTTKPKGTGLGLAIVKKLVEEHAGTIEAENREEGGAMIRVKLPVDEAARGVMIAQRPGRVEQRVEQSEERA